LHGPLAAHGGDRKSEEKENQGYAVTLIERRGNNKEETGGYAVTSSERRGNNTAYLQARIERDCPDELEAVKLGKKNGGKNYAQVAREQGWVKDRQLYLSKDPTKLAEKLQEKASAEYIEALGQSLFGQRLEQK